ncbi:MAG: hypothetical protein K0R93_992 [Anaerosolibacter sp.]|jgi:hypothetical protein|uniref:hypothetical protein n=1 Tax=Anaerosolibacter sp. TaxID=1872527 RepID=UPI002622C769|nr:hypothetical protein [Anaerosolibacter sp.]MDF2546094.1 hypothetical protein [Anaerosolibacter sp.]
MEKQERIPTMVRLKPDVRNRLETVARRNNTSLSGTIASLLENPNCVLNIYNGDVINNYNYDKKSTPTTNFVDVHEYSIER